MIISIKISLAYLEKKLRKLASGFGDGRWWFEVVNGQLIEQVSHFNFLGCDVSYESEIDITNSLPVDVWHHIPHSP